MNSTPAPAVSQEVSRRAFFQLLAFTLSLAAVPISSFFLSRDFLWHGDTTWAALTAVFMANVVLVLFVVQSMREDTSPAPSTLNKATPGASTGDAALARESKKTQ